MSSLVDRLLHRYSLAHFNKQLDLWRAAAKDVEITYAKRSRNLIAGTTTMAFIHPAIDSFCIWRHAANDDENRWEEVGLVMSPTHPPAATDLTTFSSVRGGLANSHAQSYELSCWVTAGDSRRGSTGNDKEIRALSLSNPNVCLQGLDAMKRLPSFCCSFAHSSNLQRRTNREAAPPPPPPPSDVQRDQMIAWNMCIIACVNSTASDAHKEDLEKDAMCKTTKLRTSLIGEHGVLNFGSG
ncbi:hypothetical protein GW17_00059934 [Ensete ventricosum]|nr:hypothetical protein GW17_00059934 [Ensete ventricosum]